MGIGERPRQKHEHALLATRIRRWRDDRRWSQQELADRAGIARSTLSKIENGLLSPTFEVLLKLARGFGTDLSDLVQSESHPLSSGMVIERATIENARAGCVQSVSYPAALKKL